MTKDEIKEMRCDMHKGVKMFNQELEDIARGKKEFSWEDFSAITEGFKKIRKRAGKLNLFGENLTLNKEKISKNNLFTLNDKEKADGKDYITIMNDIIDELKKELYKK